jgi:disulfide oxidoreductase YuzD
MAGPIQAQVAVVAVSGGACEGKPTWETATGLLRRQLQRRFGEAVSVEYIELFSPRSLELPDVLQGIGDESLRLPVVLVNGEVLSSGTKLNEGAIARSVDLILQSNTTRSDKPKGN